MRTSYLPIICLLAVSTFTACKRTQTAAVPNLQPATLESVQINETGGSDCDKKEDNRQDCARVDLLMPTVTGGNDVLKANVNKWISNFYSGLLVPTADAATPLPADVQTAKHTFFDQHKQAEKSVTKGGWEVQGEYRILLSDAQYLTLELTGYSYQGGAHGNPAAAVATFEVPTGKQLTWDDLVTDKAAALAVSERAFRESRPELFQPTDGSEPYTFSEPTPFALAKNVGVVPGGLYVHYVPYEVGPYAIGSTQFTLPYAALDKMNKMTKLAAVPVPTDQAKFNFEHFGTYDLAGWQKMKVAKINAGDAEITEAYYRKDGYTLKIDTVRGSYHDAITHRLYGPSGLERERTLKFMTDPDAMVETVRDHGSGAQYSRTQLLSGYYGDMKPLPETVTGIAWKQNKIGQPIAEPANRPAIITPSAASKPAKIAASHPRRKLVAKGTSAFTQPTVTLQQNGTLLLNGRKVGPLEDLRKALQNHLLAYNAIPNTVAMNTKGETGMGMRAEVRAVSNESVAGAKWVRKKAALEALNAAVGKKLGTFTQLSPSVYQTSGNYAYISAQPKLVNGSPVDYRLTPYAEDMNASWFADNAIGLLRYEKGVWKVLAYTIGVEQPPVATWVKQYDAPKALF